MLRKTVPNPYSGDWKSSVAVSWESGTRNRQFVRRSGTQTPSELRLCWMAKFVSKVWRCWQWRHCKPVELLVIIICVAHQMLDNFVKIQILTYVLSLSSIKPLIENVFTRVVSPNRNEISRSAQPTQHTHYVETTFKSHSKSPTTMAIDREYNFLIVIKC